MGRNSLKDERIEQILDAFEYCLETQGMQGTTLDSVAIRAGMARRMIRHYIGNRDALMNMAVARIVEKFNANAFAFVDDAPTPERIHAGLQYLFSEGFNQLPSTKMVAALLPVSLHEESVREAVKSIYDSFHENIDNELAEFVPKAPKEERQQGAFSIMCLSFGGGWMNNIGFNTSLNKHNQNLALEIVLNLEKKYS